MKRIGLRPNPARIDKLRGYLFGATMSSARYLNEVASGNHPHSNETDLTNRQRAATALVQGWLAMERAKTTAETTKQLGVVVVHARLEDTPQNRLSWEADAARLNDSRALEAVVVPKKEHDGG